MANIKLKSQRELEIMAQAGRIVADTLLMLKEHAVPGVTTRELNRLAEDFLGQRGAVTSYTAVKFDGVVCISFNEEVVHGIPGRRALRAGDLLSLDIAAIYDGYHADAAITFGIGPIDPHAQHLLATTEGALALAISLCVPGRRLFDVGAAVQLYVEAQGCSVVRNLVGHGIGRSMWEEPQVPNYRQETRGPILRPGMTFTIEPMVNLGTPDTQVLDDQWTIVTADGALSAHFEHTIAITKDGPRILTAASDAGAVWALAVPRASIPRGGGERRSLFSRAGAKG